MILSIRRSLISSTHFLGSRQAQESSPRCITFDSVSRTRETQAVLALLNPLPTSNYTSQLSTLGQSIHSLGPIIKVPGCQLAISNRQHSRYSDQRDCLNSRNS